MALDIYFNEVKDNKEHELFYLSGVEQAQDFMKAQGFDDNKDHEIQAIHIKMLRNHLQNELDDVISQNSCSCGQLNKRSAERLIDKLDNAIDRISFVIDYHIDDLDKDSKLIYHCSR